MKWFFRSINWTLQNHWYNFHNMTPPILQEYLLCSYLSWTFILLLGKWCYQWWWLNTWKLSSTFMLSYYPCKDINPLWQTGLEKPDQANKNRGNMIIAWCTDPRFTSNRDMFYSFCVKPSIYVAIYHPFRVIMLYERLVQCSDVLQSNLTNWQKQCNLLNIRSIIWTGLFMFKLNKTYLIHCINNVYLIKQHLSQEYSSVYIIVLSWGGWIRICIGVPAYIPKWIAGTQELELAIRSHFRYDWVMVMQVKWSCYLFGCCCCDPKLN